MYKRVVGTLAIWLATVVTVPIATWHAADRILGG
jgi:hypothetical protein